MTQETARQVLWVIAVRMETGINRDSFDAIVQQVFQANKLDPDAPLAEMLNAGTVDAMALSRAVGSVAAAIKIAVS